MGSSCQKMPQSKLEDKKQGFVIIIQNPVTKQLQSFKYYDERQKSDTLMNVMNGLCFSEKVNQKVDGNFISLYDQTEDRFHYYVQRLNGLEIDNQTDPEKGRLWVPYINHKRQDWDFLVENNVRVSILDEIVWRLEYIKKEKENKMK